MFKMASAVGLLGIALGGAGYLQIAKVQAADPQTAGPQGSRAVGPVAADGSQRALVDRYCVTCHNERLKTAGLTLDNVDIGDTKRNAEVLEKIARKLRHGLMPPQGQPRPDQPTLDAFAASLETALDREAAAAPNPGRVASHRLNRTEYVNAIQDLLGLEIDGAQLLPGDMAAASGFDNNADVLSITPGLMARYMTAATKITRLAVASPDNRPTTQVYKTGSERRDIRTGDDMPFATHGGLAVRHAFPLDGEYVFALRLKRNMTLGMIDGIEEEEHQIEVRVDHVLMKQFKIGGQFKGPDPGYLIAVPEGDVEGQRLHDYRMSADKVLEFRVPVKAGTRLVAAGFSDVAPAPAPSRERVSSGQVSGQLPGIDTLSIAGPFDGHAPGDDTPSRRAIFTCRPSSGHEEEPCARTIVTALARRAYRRPVTASDIEPLLTIYREGRRQRDFDAGIERSLEALLSSPKFLIRVEPDRAGATPGTVVRLSDLELASRLSFFLWKSLPDDELQALAARGTLKDPTILEQQVRRLLGDGRATRFMNDFAEQWLQVRNVNSLEPDGRLFRSFDDSLRKAMVRETDLFFGSQVREDRPLQELLRANYTYLNEPLARHYGIDNIYGSRFRRVTLSDPRRFGLLGHASILTVTSYANRTSVVVRGKSILENLLGAPPPPPPPNVPPLKENDGKSTPTALRERMEEHRKSPVCASCHSRMDPLGFALEHFDAIGRWRETDEGAAINATSTLSGKTLDSLQAFREALLTEGGNAYIQTVTEKLLTYALGRELVYSDAPATRQIVRDLAHTGYRWSSLVLAVVKSAPFQMQTVPGSDGPATATVAKRQ